MNSGNQSSKSRKSLIIGCCIIVALIAIVSAGIVVPKIFHIGNAEDSKDWSHGKGPGGEQESAVVLNIMAVGDIMAHETQLKAQYDSALGAYDFHNNYEYVKPYIQSADLAICNIETTFAGGNPTGYPSFNSPDTLLDAVKNTGFDASICANNHIIDKGLKGLVRTMETFEQKWMPYTGVHKPEAKPYIILNIKDVKVGILAYTYETPNVNGRKTINSIYIPNEALSMINTFSYENLDIDLIEIQNNISNMRADGADIVICYFHWGNEYQRNQNDWQERIGSSLAAYGADIIFGSHPHVLQPVDFIIDEGTGKKTPIFYSMGNFISNQRYESNENRYTEQGMIAEVNIEYMKSTKSILTIQAKTLPTWVDRYKVNGKNVYSIIPLDDDFRTNPFLLSSGHVNRAAQAFEDIRELIGDEYIKKGSAPNNMIETYETDVPGETDQINVGI